MRVAVPPEVTHEDGDCVLSTHQVRGKIESVEVGIFRRGAAFELTVEDDECAIDP